MPRGLGRRRRELHRAGGVRSRELLRGRVRPGGRDADLSHGVQLPRVRRAGDRRHERRAGSAVADGRGGLSGRAAGARLRRRRAGDRRRRSGAARANINDPSTWSENRRIAESNDFALTGGPRGVWLAYADFGDGLGNRVIVRKFSGASSAPRTGSRWPAASRSSRRSRSPRRPTARSSSSGTTARAAGSSTRCPRPAGAGRRRGC